MEELSIKIKIADREYPMRVHPSEEERLRLAGRLLNDKIRLLKDQFGIDDKQDLLAMVAFDFLVEGLKLENEKKNLNTNIADKISDLSNLISSVLPDDK
jgi:cell division protein ZapA